MDSRWILKRIYRLLFLISALIIVAVAVFYSQGGGKSPVEVKIYNPESQNNIQNNSVFAGYPSPDNFLKIFLSPDGLLDSPKKTISDICHDGYYTVIVFPSDTDYRTDPARAVFNKSYLCRQGSAIEFDLSQTISSLRPGMGYYLILADQGEKGVWYNPR